MKSISLNAAQLGIWTAEQLDHVTDAFQISQMMWLDEPLDTQLFREAVEMTCREADILRVQPQEVGQHGPELVAVDTLPALLVVDGVLSDDQIRERTVSQAQSRTKSADQFVTEFRVYSRQSGGTCWVIHTHHLLLDAYGIGLLTKRIAEIYTALASQQAVPAAWFSSCTALADQDDHDETLSAWDSHFATVADDVPFNSGLQQRFSSHPQNIQQTLAPHITELIDHQASRSQVTWSDVLTTAWGLYSAMLDGRSSFTVRLFRMNRSDRATLTAPGMCVTSVPVVFSLDPRASISELFREARQQLRSAITSPVIGEEVLAQRWPAGTDDYYAISQVNIKAFDDTYQFGASRGLQETVAKGPVGRRDLTMYRDPVHGFRCDLASSDPTLTHQQLDDIWGRFVVFLGELLDADGQTPIGFLGHLETVYGAEAAEGEQIALPSGQTLDGLVRDQTARDPGAVAVIEDDTDAELTFAEFHARVNAGAQLLVDRGVQVGDRVAVMLPRSIDLVIALVSVLRAGAGYVPVDPEYPAERIGQLLEDSSAVVVMTTQAQAAAHRQLFSNHTLLTVDAEQTAAVLAHGQTHAPDLSRAPVPADTAYVIFTSGTTGRPKGVQVSHAAITNRLAWGQARFPVGAQRTLFKTPVTFDVSVPEIFTALGFGSTLVIATDGGHKDPKYLAEAIQRRQIQRVNFVPSMAQAFLDEDSATTQALQCVALAGEALPTSLGSRFNDRIDGDLINIYGPTETGEITWHRYDQAQESNYGSMVPLGLPVANTTARVLDAWLRPVPSGVVGELYLGGPQLADGYVGQPSLSATRFIADPFSQRGDRVYRTGDLVRWDATGRLEYLGRSDDQVKIRGFRIEVDEIRAALEQHRNIRSAAVVAFEHPAGGKYLAAYYTTGGTDIPTEQLRETVGARLPDYMVPTVFTQMEHLPVTVNGKLDRNALPAPELSALSAESRMPETQSEQLVAKVFCDVLQLPEHIQLGVADDFFHLGGHSLLATRLVARVNADTGAQLTLRDVFDAPSLGNIAAALDGASGQERQLRVGDLARPAPPPASYGQQALLLSEQLDTETFYRQGSVLEIHGDLDVDALRRAIEVLVERHQILRTRFLPNSTFGWEQVVDSPHSAKTCFRILDGADANLVERVHDLVKAPVDLSREYGTRFALLQDVDGKNLLLVYSHHLVTDDQSLWPLLRDLETFYQQAKHGQRAGGAPVLNIQYADFAVWQHEILGDPQDNSSPFASGLAHWQARLAGLPRETQLPFDAPRGSIRSRTRREARQMFTTEASRAITASLQQASATVLQAVNAAFAVVLWQYGASTSIPIGLPTQLRDDPRLTDLIGYFVNTVVLRVDFSPEESFQQLLQTTRDRMLEAEEHKLIPFEYVVDHLEVERVPGRSPIFQVMSAYFDEQQMPNVAHDQADISLVGPVEEVFKQQDQPSEALYDLVLSAVAARDGTLGITLHAVQELFSQETTDALVEKIHGLLQLGLRYPELSVWQLTELLDVRQRQDHARATRSTNSAKTSWTFEQPSGAEASSGLWEAAFEHLCLELFSDSEAVSLIAHHDDTITVLGDQTLRSEDLELLVQAAGRLVHAYTRGVTTTVQSEVNMRDDELATEELDAALDADYWDSWLEQLEDTTPMWLTSDSTQVRTSEPIRSRSADVSRAQDPGRARAQVAYAVGTALVHEFAEIAGDLIIEFEEYAGFARTHRVPAVLPQAALATMQDAQSHTAVIDDLAADYQWDPRITQLYQQVAEHRILADIFDGLPEPSVRISLQQTHGCTRVEGLLPHAVQTQHDPNAQVPELEVTVVVQEPSDQSSSSGTVWVSCRTTLDLDVNAIAEAVAHSLNISGIDVPARLRDTIALEKIGLQPLPANEMETIRHRYGARSQVLALSPLQSGLFYHMVRARETGDNNAYVSQLRFDLSGDVTGTRLEDCIRTVLQRHPNVSAAFLSVHTAEVQVIPEDVAVDFAVFERSDWQTQYTTVEELLEAVQSRAFDYEQPPLVRFVLIEKAPQQWVLAMIAEHILMDGISLNILLTEIVQAYNHPRHSETARVATFKTYLQWLAQQDMESAYTAWTDYLADLAGPSILWTEGGDLVDNQVETGDLTTYLPASDSNGITQLAKHAGVTTSTVLQTAWGITLGRLLGTDDVVFGNTVSGRPPELPGSDRIVGLLFNTVPFRVQLSPFQTVEGLLQDVQEEQITMMDRPYISLSQLQERVGHGTLFDTLFVVQNFGKPQAAAEHGTDELTVDDASIHDATHYPVTFAIHPASGDEPRTRIRLSYRKDAFADQNAQQLLDRYLQVLTSLLADPRETIGSIASLLPEEEAALSTSDAGSYRAIEPVTVHELLARQAAQSPGAVALVAGDHRYTFAEFSEQVNRYARYLLDLGVRPEHRVALLLPRDERIVIAMFAIFAVGAAYVPIDAEHPDERIDYMLAMAEPKVTLVSDRDVHRLGSDSGTTSNLDAAEVRQGIRHQSHAPLSDAERGGPVLPEHLAYVIFTSGSTGRPKGVAINYRGLTNMYVNHREKIFDQVVEHQQGRRMKIAHTTSFSFDASWEQLFWMLNGHEIHVIDDELRREPQRLLEHYDRQRIDGFDVTPSYGQLLVDAGLLERDRPSGRSVASDAAGVVFVSLGGENVPERLWTTLREAPGVESYNLYGPTEYTINALGADLADSPTSSVGSPILNTSAYILDENLQPTIPGVPGELYLAGDGIARGYWQNAGLTAERFVACPWAPGQRMYRTGDLTRWTEDHQIDYLGRADDQVKIRGYRIEPGEVADVLAADPQVARAAVIPRTDAHGDVQLFGYMVPSEGSAEALEIDTIRQRARTILPDYMIPAGLMALDEIPLTVNGKVDSRALPKITVAAKEYRAPETALEQLLADTLAELLGVEHVSTTENFFDIGGNSLLAMRFVARVNAELEQPLMVKDVFTAQTVQTLSALAERSIAEAGSAVDVAEAIRVPLRASKNGRYLFCAHARYGHATVYQGLDPYVPEQYGMMGLQDPIHGGSDAEFETFADLIATYADVVCNEQPNGLVDLLGWSYGGHIVFALAQELQRRGRVVSSLTVIDTLPVPEGFVPDSGDVLPSRYGAVVNDTTRQQQFMVSACQDLTEAFGNDLDDMLRSPAQERALAVSGLRCEQMMSEPTRGVLRLQSLVVLTGDRAHDCVSRQAPWQPNLPNHEAVLLEGQDHYSVVTADQGMTEWGPKLHALLLAAANHGGDA